MSEAITAIATITATIFVVVGTGLLLGSHRVSLRHMDHRLQDIRLKAARTHHYPIVVVVQRHLRKHGIFIHW